MMRRVTVSRDVGQVHGSGDRRRRVGGANGIMRIILSWTWIVVLMMRFRYLRLAYTGCGGSGSSDEKVR